MSHLHLIKIKRSDVREMGLTLYSELECQGKSVVIKDNEVNLSKAGLTFNAKVCIFYEIHQNCLIIFVTTSKNNLNEKKCNSKSFRTRLMTESLYNARRQSLFNCPSLRAARSCSFSRSPAWPRLNQRSRPSVRYHRKEQQ